MKVTPTISETYTVGAILENSWGYEQTNYDFYCIVERKDMWVKIYPMTKIVEPGPALSMETKERPDKIDWDAKPIRRRIKVFSQGEAGFAIENGGIGSGWCRLWKGQTRTATHYA